MDIDVDTFLSTVYCVVDDLYQAHYAAQNPVPLMRCCRGVRHHLFAEEAAVGRGGSDRAWYYGLSLLTVVRADGVLTGFVLGPATTEERWLAEALLRWRQDPSAPPPTAEDLAPALGPTPRAKRAGPAAVPPAHWGRAARG